MDTPHPVVFIHYWFRKLWDKRQASTFWVFLCRFELERLIIGGEARLGTSGERGFTKENSLPNGSVLRKTSILLLLFNSLYDSRKAALESRVWGLYSLYSLLFFFSFALYNSSEVQSNTPRVTVCVTHSSTASLVSLFPDTLSNATKDVQHLLSALAKLSHHPLF